MHRVRHLLFLRLRSGMAAANGTRVALGVAAFAILAALPFTNKKVLDREQSVAKMRDASLDAKDAARDGRLSRKQ